jgi:predicted membrane channel-forming protein YqfA (hemolysin III family)
MQDFNSLPPTTRLAMGVMGVWATVSLASLAAQAALFVMLPAVVCLSFGLVALSFQVR